MSRVKLAGKELLGLMCVLLLSPSAWAQQASGIAGVVKDTSGAVLPGVTVEAASPALIEKVRSVITDGEGRYNIVDLRPGTYAVAFTLAGFSTLKREGIALTSGFTATVNADLRVGTLEETVTVTGEAPLVDTQNVRQQNVISESILNALPSGAKNFNALTILVPGLVGQTDVGGLGAVQSASAAPATYHGKTGGKWTFDSMGIENLQGTGNASYVMNQAMIEETTVQTGGAGADTEIAAVTINGIPKQGGNAFTGQVLGTFGNKGMQSSNLDDFLRGRGLDNVNRLRHIYDVTGALGGPIKQDRVWFYTSVRVFDVESEVAGIFNNLTPHTPFYTKGTEPAIRLESYESYATRVTWQVSGKNKIGLFADLQPRCDCRRPGNLAPEAQTVYDFWPEGLYQGNWTMPVTNRLLLEAGASMMQSHYTNPPPGGATLGPNDISILESQTQLRYGAPNTLRFFTDSHRFAQRFALSYVTGSHTFKTGVYQQEGVQDSEPYLNQAIAYTFNFGKPTTITQDAGPYLTRNRLNADLGIYAQDQWAIDRLTLNYGVRFEYVRQSVLSQHVDATRWLPARDFGPVSDVPNWKDLEPRLGVAYDLFGNGKTALKASLGRYVGTTAVEIAAANNPITTSVNSINRSWDDTSFGPGDPRTGNFVADCDLTNFAKNGECGKTNNDNFGKNDPKATQWSPDVTRGFGVRPYFWEYSVELQQQLRAGLSLNAGYYHNWAGNFTVTDNLLWDRTDFSPYCITAPKDPRLANGGGYQVCGLYDISEDKFSSAQNLVSPASTFGRQKKVNDYLSAGFNARLGKNARFGGGLDTGRGVTDNCFVVDSPQQQLLTIDGVLNCHVVAGWAANLQIKLNGSYSLPYDFVVSGVFQNIAGQPILANYTATTGEILPSLGRNLAGATKTVTVPLIVSNTLFEDRRNQLDLRLGKRFPMGPRRHLQVNLDLYNAMNSNSITLRNNAYGGSFGTPLSVLDGRMLQVSGNVTF